MENVLDILKERGFVQQVSDEEGLSSLLQREPITLYQGFDATAPSLHVGNLVGIMGLAWFQRAGHRPIALVGGGTTLIGDPTGRQSSRPILTEEEIERNAQGIKSNLMHFLDFEDGRALLLNNAPWLKPLNFLDFMRDIGSRFSVNEVLRLDAYRTRLEAGGMSFLELSYVLMQSYDFLQLYETWQCVLQVGGSDQWGNSVEGADLIRRVTGKAAFVLTFPLISSSEGTKMGKTAGGPTIWLDPQRTSPYEYYQYWRNVPDSSVEQSLAIFTFLPMGEVRQLASGQGAELNRAKEVLAFEATRLAHGEAEAIKARDAARALFAGGEGGAAVPAIEIARERLQTLGLLDLFKEAGLVTSSNEARNLIAQAGLSVNGEPVTDPRASLGDYARENEHLMLSRGRKRHMRVVLR